jgi:hypothetical protein
MRVSPNGYFTCFLLFAGACGAPREAAVVPAPAPSSSASAETTTPESATPESGAPAALRDRDLYEILVRLARDPGSVPELAPRVESIHGPMEGVDSDEAVARGEPVSERVADPSALIARYGEMVFVERDGAESDEEDEPEVSCTCDAALLTCTLHQSGGTTELRFAREGARVVLTEHHWEYP